MRRQDFADLLEPGIRKIVMDQYKAMPQKYDKIFHVLESTKATEEDTSMSGIGIFDESGESEVTNYEDPTAGYPVSYVHKKFKKGIKITEEMYEDDQYNKIDKMSKSLGTAAARTIEVKAASILNHAFDTTVAMGGDGKALCASDHPRADGGAAQSNYTTMDLAEDALHAARLAMRSTLDDKGQKIVVVPSTLIVAPSLEDTAKILIKSTGRPGTVNLNEVNVNENAYEMLVWDYIDAASGGSDTHWFLQDKVIHELNFFWRKRFVLERDNSFDTDELLMKGKMRFSVGFSNWRGFYGSKGDNS